MEDGTPNVRYYLTVLSSALDFIEREMGEAQDAFAHAERAIALQEAREAIDILSSKISRKSVNHNKDAA